MDGADVQIVNIGHGGLLLRTDHSVLTGAIHRLTASGPGGEFEVWIRIGHAMRISEHSTTTYAMNAAFAMALNQTQQAIVRWWIAEAAQPDAAAQYHRELLLATLRPGV
jgi:hypothetical protein